MSPTAFTDKNLYSYCDNNPIMRIDATGNLWTAVRIIAGGLLNVLTSYLGSLVTGDEYTWKDLAWDAFIGTIENIGKKGFVFAITTDAIRSGIKAYIEEQSVGKSIVIATVTLGFNLITISNASSLLRDKTVKEPIETASKVFFDIFANLVFDSPSSMLSAAVSKAVTENGV